MLPRVIGNTIDSIRVLHVDDDPNQFEFIKFFLNQVDPVLNVKCVGTPEEVFRELEEHPYDCLVTDFQMPLMDGIELSKKVREKHDVPIILYTGQGSEEVAESAFTVGVDDYLRKEMDPSHYQVLAKRIRHVVEKKRAEMLYQRVVEGIRDGLCIVYGKEIVYANQVQAEMFGAKKIEDIIGTNALDFVHPDDKELAEKRWRQRALGELDPPFIKYKVNRLNGETFEAEALTNIIQYNGKPAFLVLTRDITERSRLEAEKRKSEERFKNIIELAPDGIVTVSMKGIVTSANPAFLRITGYDAKEIIGKRFYRLGSLRSIDLRNNLRIFAQIVRGKLPPPVEFVFQYKDGAQGWGEAHLGYIDKEDTKELLAIVRDITERKWVEKELTEYNGETKNLNSEQNGKDNPKHFLWSNHITSTIGLNLQDSLFVLKNSILNLRNNPSKLNELLDKMEASVDTASIELKELFEGDQPVKTELCDISYIVEKSIDELDVPPEISIKTSINGQDAFYVEPRKLRDAIKEILENSIIAMPNGGDIALNCDVQRDSLIIEIKDASQGMTEKEQEKLINTGKIEKESRVYSIEKAQDAVEEQNGSILINSENGKGTTYTLIVPWDYRNEILTHDYQSSIHRVVS